LTGQQKAKDKVVILLDVSAEGIRWQRALDSSIRRALDDRGQQLTADPFALVDEDQSNSSPERASMGMPRELEDRSEPVPVVPIRLRLGPRRARSLKELTGTLLAELRTPSEPVVTVEDVLHPPRGIVRGARAGAVRILDVEREEEDGWVRLRVQVEPVPQGLSEGVTLPPNTTIIVDGRVVGGRRETLTSSSFALLDARGRPLQVLRAFNTGKRAGNLQELELIYRLDAGQGPPARFVYRDRRTVLLEVPFTLRDIPLP